MFVQIKNNNNFDMKLYEYITRIIILKCVVLKDTS